MSGAAHNRGRSRQDYETPWELIAAVEDRFGTIEFDLAASSDNAKSERYCTESADSFQQDWSAIGGLLWLNPPYADIAVWAKKCEQEAAAGARIAFLVPASVGSCWYAQHVHGKALVLPLRPRVSFDGQDPYPKDIVLCVYGEPPGFEPWRWKGQGR